MTRTDLTTRRTFAALAVLALAVAGSARGQDAKKDVNEANERALKAASERVAPGVVKIETAGGLEVGGGGGPPPKKGAPPPPPVVRRGTGPTTGVVVSADGFIVTSAFNFANKPTDIFVTIPGRDRLVAKVVASDLTRQLTLLKVEATDLPVPATFPRKDMRVGQWAVALGRTLDTNTNHPPSVSAGILSALNRIWGKAIQTDAKISPANYGGPLVSIDGRVLGILVPADPETEGATAGFTWYDSGMGFAIPFEDVMAALPRLKAGKDLRKGLLGVIPTNASVYVGEFVVGTVQPDSAAAKAGIKVGDKIVAFDDKPTPDSSTFQHLIGPKYEGDAIKLKVKRGEEVIDFPNVVLGGTLTAYVAPFLGVLPIRDDPKPGVEIRFVYPNSPAAAAGLKEGDRIAKMGRADAKELVKVADRKGLTATIAGMTPGTEIKIEVERKEGKKTDTVSAKLATTPDTLPEKLPARSSVGEDAPPKKDMEPAPVGLTRVAFQEPKKDEKVETGYLKRTDEALGREYWLYVPDNYDAKVSHGLLVWFHPPGQGGKDGERMSRTFRDFCESGHYILMGPKSQDAERWVPGEAEMVLRDVNAVLKQYTIDRSRVVAHGMGSGGQMAFHLGFHARDVFRGVATMGAVLGTPPKDATPTQPLSFFIATGDKDPAIKDVQASKAVLDDKKFPVVYREIGETGKEYFDRKTFDELLVWLDSLDRI